MSETRYRKIALLTDKQAEGCLQILLKVLTIDEPDYARLLDSPEDMREVIQTAAREEGIAVTEIKEDDPDERSKAVRLILTELAADEKLGPQVEVAIDDARAKLIEPVTTALVLAGIIFVLSIDFNVKYNNKGGKKEFNVNIKKQATSNTLLGKFFNLFK